FLVGLSIPLGEGVLASAGVSRDRGSSANATVDVVKPLSQQPGSFGWRVHDSGGRSPDSAGAGPYRPSAAPLGGGGGSVGHGASAQGGGCALGRQGQPRQRRG